MKRSSVITIISLQLIILIALGVMGVKLYDTSASLATTISIMSDIDAERKALEKEEKQRSKDVAAMKTPLKIGQEAPAFTSQDENSQEVSLANYKGKDVLMVFSDPNCERCANIYPALNQFKQENQELEVVVVQYNTTPEANKAYKQKMNIQAPVLTAIRSDMMNYKIEMPPTSILIDKEGKFAGRGVFTTAEEWTSFVEQSIAAHPVTQEEGALTDG